MQLGRVHLTLSELQQCVMEELHNWWSSQTLPISLVLESQKEGLSMNRAEFLPPLLFIVKLSAYLLWSIGSLSKQTPVDSGTDINNNKRLLSGSLGWDSLWRKLPKDVSTLDSKLLPCRLRQVTSIHTVQPISAVLGLSCAPLTSSRLYTAKDTWEITTKSQHLFPQFNPNLTYLRSLKLRECLPSSGRSIFILMEIDHQNFI